MDIPAGSAGAVDDLALLAAALRAVPEPPLALPGWQSLCAAEYTAAALRIGAALASARAAVDVARMAR